LKLRKIALGIDWLIANILFLCSLFYHVTTGSTRMLQNKSQFDLN